MSSILSDRISSALGKTKCDIVIKNTNIVNVISGKVIHGDVGISGDRFVGIGDYSGIKEIDGKDKFIIPAFTDAHVHIESTMLTPYEYFRVASAHGVLRAVVDPHEIANVCGIKGLDFMKRSINKSLFDFILMIPSCVPSTPFEENGAVLDAECVENLSKDSDYWGLGELMNFPGLLNGDKEVLDKIQCFEHIDGHAPGVMGKELNAYICAGINNDHECCTKEEVTEKLDKGMYIHLREGTASKTIKEFSSLINSRNLSRFTFCTDDLHIDEFTETGSIDNAVRVAIKAGIDPIDAITIAAYNPCICYGLKNKGAILPGYFADFIISDSLELNNIEQVYKSGVLVAEKGRSILPQINEDIESVTNTVLLEDIAAEDLNLDFVPGARAIQLFKNSLYTDISTINNEDKRIICAVINRYKLPNKIGKVFLKGCNIDNGAIATCISHDSHNVVVIGDNPQSMAVAVNSIKDSSGGCVVVSGKEVIASMELPIAGIISKKSHMDVYGDFSKIKNALKKVLNKDDISLFMMLSFVSLLVIPAFKINESGLFDVNNQKFI